MARPVENVPDRWAVAAPLPGDATAIEVHAAGESTFLLRQSKRTSPEAPILVLLLGAKRALLVDTGDSADPATWPLRETVDALIDGWLIVHPCDDYALVVAHSHAHGDHVAGDGQFQGRPRTSVVGHSSDAVRSFFALDGPEAERAGAFDLGGRELLVLATPGHHPSAITFYDPSTELLLTGDTVYPGRLYVDDLPRFVTSLERLVAFASEHPVTAVVGAHVEMSRTPGRDYPLGARFQPDEAPLALSPRALDDVLTAGREMTATGAGRVTRDRFVVIDDSRHRERLRLVVRARCHALLGRNRLR
jgi:glyoxylase-like metal-dependent hydrolase (beta-lactamase superfamily II)